MEHIWIPESVTGEIRGVPEDLYNFEKQVKGTGDDFTYITLFEVPKQGRVIQVDGPADLIQQATRQIPEAQYIGSTLKVLHSWAEGNDISHARAIRNIIESPEYREKKGNRTLDKYFGKGKLRSPLDNRRGTYTYDWVGADTDPWSSDFSPIYLATYGKTGAGAKGEMTFEIEGNTGRIIGPVGGAVRGNKICFYYNLEGTLTSVNFYNRREDNGNAELNRYIGMFARADLNESGTSSFYEAYFQDQAGNDNRLNRVNSEVATLDLVSTGPIDGTTYNHQRLIITNDGSNDPDFDSYNWVDANSEPGTPTYSYTDTSGSALDSAGYYGFHGIWGRDTDETVEDYFELTNNDPATTQVYVPVPGIWTVSGAIREASTAESASTNTAGRRILLNRK